MSAAQQQQHDVSLRQQLDSFKAQRSAPASPEAQKMQTLFAEDRARLVASGIAEQSLAVGQRAPDFALPDALGNAVALADLLARGPVVVTFYRGEWCPYCNLTLRAYQKALPQMRALGATLVAISPQTPDNSLTTVEKKELTFPVVSDVGNRVARQFGVVFTVSEELRPYYQAIGSDVTTFNGDQSWELPIPATFVIARDGTVRLAYVDPDYTHRLEPSAILASLRALAETKV